MSAPFNKTEQKKTQTTKREMLSIREYFFFFNTHIYVCFNRKIKKYIDQASIIISTSTTILLSLSSLYVDFVNIESK